MEYAPTNPITSFLKRGSAGGILLMLAAALAIFASNSPLQPYYTLLLSTPVEIRIGALEIAKPLLLWINDGLMTVFFFLVGLELKRELLEGELADRRNIILPGVGAVGGMLVPALVYLFFNADHPESIRGWAIPAATDIAFALGVLSLLGSRIPVAVKVFLTSLAIFDDVGAILVIALFYTENLAPNVLLVVVVCAVVLFVMNRRDVHDNSPYILIGVIMWIATLKSGVHATLTGVLLAMFIPLRSRSQPQLSPLKALEHDLQPIVSFFILPVFAFANAGLNLSGVGLPQLLHPVPLGIALGLFLGKQVGIFGLCWLTVKLRLAPLPRGIDWLNLYGVSLLGGIGFTMSLFISSLAFEETGGSMIFDERLGIIFGSLVSGLLGFLVLRYWLRRQRAAEIAREPGA